MTDTSPDPWKNYVRICLGDNIPAKLRNAVSMRARRVLSRGGIETIKQARDFVRPDKDGFCRADEIRECGRVTVNEIRKALGMKPLVVAGLSDAYLRTVTATLAKHGYKVVKMPVKEKKP
jgi:hypothetical protein